MKALSLLLLLASTAQAETPSSATLVFDVMKPAAGEQEPLGALEQNIVLPGLDCRGNSHLKGTVSLGDIPEPIRRGAILAATVRLEFDCAEAKAALTSNILGITYQDGRPAFRFRGETN